MHIYNIPSLQVLLGGIVHCKLGTGFYLGSLDIPRYMTQIDWIGLQRV